MTATAITREQSQAWWNGAPNAKWNMHHDLAFAQRMGFDDLVIAAPHLVALTSDVLRDRFGDDWLRTGAVELRFKSSVLAGDTVSITAEVTEAVPVADGTMTTLAVALRVRRDGAEADRAACVGTASVIVR